MRDDADFVRANLVTSVISMTAEHVQRRLRFVMAKIGTGIFRELHAGTGVIRVTQDDPATLACPSRGCEDCRIDRERIDQAGSGGGPQSRWRKVGFNLRIVAGTKRTGLRRGVQIRRGNHGTRLAK